MAARSGAAQESEPGSDLEYQIEISFWEAVRGTVKNLTITRLEACTDCNGTGAVGSPQSLRSLRRHRPSAQTSGKMRFNLACTRCGGTGRVRTPAALAEAKAASAARIPSRCASRPACRPARACASPATAMPEHTARPPGDLYIVTEVQPHPYFDRRGDDLYTVVPITVTEAALGAKIEVPTLDGRSLLRVPPGTNSGQKLRLREKGVPRCGNTAIAAICTSSCR